MDKSFTAKQKEIVARKMGYDGPMQMFDEFLAASASDSQRYSAITSKFAERMAKGGMVKKYFVGGMFESQVADRFAADLSKPNTSTSQPSATTASANNQLYLDAIGNATNTPPSQQSAPLVGPLPNGGDTTTSLSTITRNDAGAPSMTTAPGYTAAQTATTPKADVTNAGTVTAATGTTPAVAQTVTTPDTVNVTDATTTATTSDIRTEQAKQAAATGTVSEGAKATAQTGTLSGGATAKTQQVGSEYKTPVVSGQRTTGEGELVTAVTDAPVVKSETAQAAAPAAVQAAQGVVKAEELVKPAQIAEADMAQATAITAEGLAPDAKVVAARLEKFTVDDGTLAAAAQGNVDAQSTVQGQLTELMKSFDDGATPAWAAGAIRAANAVMASRGLGGSSMAATAVFQAAMESALPIAVQDAQVFQQMGMANLNNRQQTALANAAAQQGLSLQNLSNEQQARLTNAANSFALQSQNLSNMQQTMLANTQIRATLQGQNLSNQQQAAVVNAARYAEMANINLNNIQQAALHNSSMQVQVDISNASNRQQTALANAQIEAAMQGKVLDNKQQAAVLNATRIAENNNLTFTAAQQAALNNSQLMKDIGIANLNAAQQTTIANAAAIASMDIANLNNRQQAAVVTAQAFLATDLKNLDNKQQLAVIQSQQIAESILSDAAAKNAASLTNATNAIEVDKINATLALTASQFTASEKNKIAVANMDAANELIKFNAQEANDRADFNARLTTEISLANAKILADISVANTAAVNAANAVNAKNATDLSASQYAQQSQTYRDLLSYSWKTGESAKDRIANLAVASIQKDVANIKADADSSSSLGENLVKLGVAIWG